MFVLNTCVRHVRTYIRTHLEHIFAGRKGLASGLASQNISHARLRRCAHRQEVLERYIYVGLSLKSVRISAHYAPPRGGTSAIQLNGKRGLTN